MINREIATTAAQLASGALQSGRMPVDAVSVAKYYMELYRLIKKEYDACEDKPASGAPHGVLRLTEEPEELG